MNRAVRGALSGVIATLAMSIAMAAGRALGLLRTPPPQQITGRAEQKAGAHPSLLPDEIFHASWVAAHLGFGAGAGIAYALGRSLFPRSRVLSGLAFGGAVWGISYVGLMPALGLYPAPDEDDPSRTAVMIAAHAVYGVTLAEVYG